MSNFYLTIDDGPSKDTVKKLKFFETHNIRAIWFCLGKNLEQYPDIAIELIKKGHIIGNHSYSHPFFSKTGLDKCRNEIIKTEKIIDRLYKKANVVRPVKLFRFPYGDQGHFEDGKPSDNPKKITHKAKLQKLLKNLGFQPGSFPRIEYKGIYSNQPEDLDWLWSYDIKEWSIGNTGGFKLTHEQIKENLKTYLKTYSKNKNQIILIHDHDRKAKYFYNLIRTFLKSKVRFVLPKFI